MKQQLILAVCVIVCVFDQFTFTPPSQAAPRIMINGQEL